MWPPRHVRGRAAPATFMAIPEVSLMVFMPFSISRRVRSLYEGRAVIPPLPFSFVLRIHTGANDDSVK